MSNRFVRPEKAKLSAFPIVFINPPRILGSPLAKGTFFVIFVIPLQQSLYQTLPHPMRNPIDRTIKMMTLGACVVSILMFVVFQLL